MTELCASLKASSAAIKVAYRRVRVSSPVARVIDGRRDAVAIVGGEAEGVTFLEALVGSGTETDKSQTKQYKSPKTFHRLITANPTTSKQLSALCF